MSRERPMPAITYLSMADWDRLVEAATRSGVGVGDFIAAAIEQALEESNTDDKE